MSSIKLPRPHLSWSQLDLWERSPQKYKDYYFYDKPRFVNDAMRFGSKFATAMETGDAGDDELMQMAILSVPQYKVAEYRLESLLDVGDDQVKLLSFLDTSHDPPSEGIREYKTGKSPWTQRRVDKHGQLTFYALGVYLNEKKIPHLTLDWLETENLYGKIVFTGKVVSYETVRTVGDLIEMTTRIKRAVSGISAAYQQYLDEII